MSFSTHCLLTYTWMTGPFATQAGRFTTQSAAVYYSDWPVYSSCVLVSFCTIRELLLLKCGPFATQSGLFTTHPRRFSIHTSAGPRPTLFGAPIKAPGHRTRCARRDRICLLLHAVLAFYRICLLSHAVLAFARFACFYTLCSP